ncbi:MAG: alpha-mannosidase [Planctomycetaceae bacterium]|nr:alpha-mannosidase [Planctomycetaceae bacterium]
MVRLCHTRVVGAVVGSIVRVRFRLLLASVVLLGFVGRSAADEERLVNYVDPFLGTAPLTNVADIGFDPPWRVWAGLTFPGASRPNAMVQLSPITEFGSGAGYEYEDEVIHAFAHTNKGHWNLCHIPVLPVTGEIDARDFGSAFDHQQETASPGYYQVFLKRYGVDAELTTTLRCGRHRYAYPPMADRAVVFNLAISNERIREYELVQVDQRTVHGFQYGREKVCFSARFNADIVDVEQLPSGRRRGGRSRTVHVVRFAPSDAPLEMDLGLSFVSVENAKLNLDEEVGDASFDQTKSAAAAEWEELLGKVRVAGGTDRQRGLFYSSLYRSFLWPALRSDANGQFLDASGQVVSKDFDYYTNPSLWDDYRNKLVLLCMLTPDVAENVIKSMIDRGVATGFMPTFFHGDHASAFIAGAYLRGLRGFNVRQAFELMLKNATVESSRARPHLDEYIERGYVATPSIESPVVETKAKAGVTKTLEYAYDDYAVAVLAREIGEQEAAERMLERSNNYRNVFDPQAQLMRGRLANGDWVEPFDDQYPYYEYMYREANAWQSSFFAPHDTEGLVALFPDAAAFERQLDRLFSIPWNPQHIAMNVNSFIGQYCHGNQPDHGFPYLYYWVGKQEKSQAILDEIMDRFYGMDDGRTLCGMDDAGEMSAWYVFNAIGLYPYSPADAEYLICVPVFDEIQLRLGEGEVAIRREGDGRKIVSVTSGSEPIAGLAITHGELIRGGDVLIRTKQASDAP